MRDPSDIALELLRRMPVTPEPSAEDTAHAALEMLAAAIREARVEAYEHAAAVAENVSGGHHGSVNRKRICVAAILKLAEEACHV